MSDMINPYESTQANVDEKRPLAAQGFFTASMIGHLKAASPWMKFIGIVSFIGAGLLIIVGVLILLLLPYLSQEIDFSATFFAGFFSSVLGFSYLASGIICIFPAKFLYSAASKISLFIKTQNERAMEIALRNNKSFWKFYGIAAIVSLSFIPLVFAASIIIAVVGYAM